MPRKDQGVFDNRYKVIPRTLIFLTDGDKVLLLKGAASKRLWANRYNGIGGHIERGEDVIGAACRELLEETGLKSGDLWLCGNILIDADPQTGIAIYILKGKYQGGTLKESEEGSLEWISVDQVMNYLLVEDLYQLLPIVLSWEAGDAPFYGKYWYDENDRMQTIFRQ